MAKKTQRKYPPTNRAIYLVIDGRSNHIIGHAFYTTAAEAEADAKTLREKMPKHATHVHVARLRHVHYFKGKRHEIRSLVLF